MTDYEKKDQPGQESTPDVSETVRLTDPAGAAPDNGPVPHLTIDPDPVPPENPAPETSAPETGAAGQPFQMPEPPHAPEPPKEAPAYQQSPSGYAQPQYGAPQYDAPQPGGQPPYQAPYYQQNNKPLYNVPPAGYVQKSRLAAGLLGLLFGTLGIHNFYLGFNTRATIQLIVSLAGGLLTCGVATMAMAIWGFVEGILILTASNPSRTYDGNGVILRD